MSSYVIRHVDGGYLRKGSNAKWERTASFILAERMEYFKAQNVINNCIGPALRDCWEIVEEDEAKAPFVRGSAELTEPSEIDGFDWKEISAYQLKLYNNMSAYGEQLRRDLRNVDLEICDIEHYIEFFALDAAKGYKAYRMLKERLKRRRHIKDEMAKVNCFLAGSSGDFSSGKIDRQIKGFDNCRYTPRVLSELFGLDSGEKCLQHVS